MKLNRNYIILIFILFNLALITQQGKSNKRRVKSRSRADPAPATTPAAATPAATPAAAGNTSNSSAGIQGPMSLQYVLSQLQSKYNNEQQKLKMVLDVKRDAKDISTNHTKYYDYVECSLKQGYLTWLKALDQQDGKTIATGKHVFVVLNKETVSIFESENVNSLIGSLRLSYIKDVKIVPKNQVQFPYQLCALNQDLMQEWIDQIKNMEQCVPKGIDGAQQSNNYVDIIISRKKQELKQEINKDFQQQWDQEKKIDDAEREQLAREEDEKNMINGQMSQAMSDLEKKRAEELKIKRMERYKRLMLERKKQAEQQKEKCVEQKLESVEYANRKKYEIKVVDEVEKQVKNDLDDALKQIKANRQQDLDLLKQKEHEEFEERVQEKERQQDIMIQRVMEYERIIDPPMCYSSNVTQQVRNQVCSQFQDPGKPIAIEKLNQCLNKNTFCKICCEYNIGKIYLDQRSECTEKCISATVIDELPLNTNATDDYLLRVKKNKNFQFWNHQFYSEKGTNVTASATQ